MDSSWALMHIKHTPMEAPAYLLKTLQSFSQGSVAEGLYSRDWVHGSRDGTLLYALTISLLIPSTCGPQRPQHQDWPRSQANPMGTCSKVAWNILKDSQVKITPHVTSTKPNGRWGPLGIKSTDGSSFTYGLVYQWCPRHQVLLFPWSLKTWHGGNRHHDPSAFGMWTLAPTPPTNGGWSFMTGLQTSSKSLLGHEPQ